MIKKLLCRLFDLQEKPKTVARIGRTLPLPEMDAVRLRNALCVELDQSLWQAVHQVLDDQRADVLAEAVSAENVGRQDLQAYYAGGYAHLERLQRWLLDARESARKSLQQ